MRLRIMVLDVQEVGSLFECRVIPVQVAHPLGQKLRQCVCSKGWEMGLCTG